jgi:hypothetical protein
VSGLPHNFEKCPKCGTTKHKFIRCPSCRFAHDESLIKKASKLRRKAQGNGQKYTKQQIKEFKAINKEIRKNAKEVRNNAELRRIEELNKLLDTCDPIPRCDVLIGFGEKSKLTNKNQGKFGVPKDKIDYSPDAIINRGWKGKDY